MNYDAWKLATPSWYNGAPCDCGEEICYCAEDIDDGDPSGDDDDEGGW